MPTGLQELLGVELPIIQAPMAGMSTLGLAAAVADAGALGSLSVGVMARRMRAGSSTRRTRARLAR